MTNEMMVCDLIEYCNSCGKCYNCGLRKLYNAEVDKYTDDYGCAFEDMDEQMVAKIYSWYTELNQAIFKSTEAECYSKEPNNSKPNIEPKVERHYAICQKLNAVYKAKNHDYGDSFGNTYKKLGVISAVTRLSDKMNRLMSLAVKHNARVKDEKIEDTLLDMANYAIMTLIELGYEVNE